MVYDLIFFSVAIIRVIEFKRPEKVNSGVLFIFYDYSFVSNKKYGGHCDPQVPAHHFIATLDEAGTY